MAEASDPHIFLVGAGPGATGLLTLRAAELLRSADLVIYDQLVPPRILEFAKPAAELLCVRELTQSPVDKYTQILQLMIERAQQGQMIVRLKVGDPLVFGRGGEEAELLRNAGVNYEIVPGVTAALAAAAYLDLPMTHRGYSGAIAFVTGQDVPTKPGGLLDWRPLAEFPGTLAIYMGIARLPIIVNELLKYGRDPNTPCLIVEKATMGDMRTVTSRLADLDAARRNGGLELPGLIVIGEAVSHRRTPSWYEQRPLFGQRVLVTRPKTQADSLLRRLELLGAVAHHLPCVEIRLLADTTLLDAALQQLRAGEWDWLLFSSANGVRAMVERLETLGCDARDWGRVKLGVVGHKTADVLREYRLRADVIADGNSSAESLAATLMDRVRGQRVLVVRANRGRTILRDQLSEIATVGEVVAYEQMDTIDPNANVLALLRRGEIGFVTLTSSNIATGFLAMCDETIRGRMDRGELRLVTISHETANTVRSLGFPVAGVAKQASNEGLIAEVVCISRGSCGQTRT
jgi:uroporphyrinogen III methyltransferase / synthase